MTLEEAFNDIKEFFNDDIRKTLIWFYTENTLLGGVSPMYMILIGRTNKLCGFIKSQLEGNHP